MKHEQADLWDRYDRGEKIVVTTNVGWCLQTGRNNMGAGLALQAAGRFPWLPKWYGQYCRHWVVGNPRRLVPVRTVPVVEIHRLILFPVKPLLDYANPERSWDQTARLDVIRVSLTQLTRHLGNIALGFPGCGNGGLKPADVLPLLYLFLQDDRFTVCDWEFPVGDTSHRLGVNSAVDGLGMLNQALATTGLEVKDGQLVRSPA